MGHQLSLIALFFLNTAFLLHGSIHVGTDQLELLRYCLYVLPPILFTLLSRDKQTFVLMTGLLVCIIHLFIALSVGSYANSLFTVDHRLVLLGFDRSPGATGQLALVVAILLVIMRNNAPICSQRSLLELSFAVFATILVILTQSRACFLVVLLWAALHFKPRYLFAPKFIVPSFVAACVGIAIFWESLWSMLLRSLGSGKLSGRSEIWQAFFVDFSDRSPLAKLFGENFSRQIIEIPAMGYQTSDVHNHFLDIVNYFGMAMPTLFWLWYFGFITTSSKLTRTHLAPALTFFIFLPLFMTSSTFKFGTGIYTSVLMMLLPLYVATRPQKEITNG